tara:strand:- start:3189 stop:3518 length:330 start_codon:yes stop_codon:yes gene_type:complete
MTTQAKDGRILYDVLSGDWIEPSTTETIEDVKSSRQYRWVALQGVENFTPDSNLVQEMQDQDRKCWDMLNKKQLTVGIHKEHGEVHYLIAPSGLHQCFYVDSVLNEPRF